MRDRHIEQPRMRSNIMERAGRLGDERGLLAVFTRLRDLMAAALALAALSPLLIVLGGIARISTGSSALFRQVRVGINGRPFLVYKFRTLRTEAPCDVRRCQAEHHATPIGKFLRRFKLDELPQLWNVLRGDMSMVGPRPIIPAEYRDGSHYQRLRVRPGLTGLWQLSPAREEPFDAHPEYDLFYLANRSLTLDAWLIWRTILLLVAGRETKIRLAAKLWERNASWRELVSDRARAIPHRKGPLRSTVWATGVASVAFLCAAPGIAMALVAREDLLTARAAMLEAAEAIRRAESAAAAAALDQASERFGEARRKLSSWPALGLRIAPVLDDNLEVPLALALSGADLVAAGREAVQLSSLISSPEGGPTLRSSSGRIDLTALAAAAEGAEALRRNVARAEHRMDATPGKFLIPTVARSRAEIRAALADLREQAAAAVAALDLLPGALGAEGPRIWLVGAENSAELRGRGGYVGSVGILRADGGRLELGEFKALTDLPLQPYLPLEDSDAQEFRRQYLELGGLATSQNLLMTPDFPLGASMLLTHLEQSGGIAADGLIALDPTALSYLLRVTGPVEVEGIPEPLTADNIVDWSLNRIYFLYEQDNFERRERLTQITAAIWNKVLSAEGNSLEIVRALGRAISERHLVLYSKRADEQGLIERLGWSGRVEQTRGDYLLLTSQNAGENKLDYYKSRTVSYRARMEPDGSLDAQLSVTVKNTAAPGTIFPSYVGGERQRIELAPGRSRDFLSVFVPAQARLYGVQRNGEPTTEFESSLEVGKRRFASYVELGPGESATLTFAYRLPGIVVGGRYKLLIQNQATVVPDKITVHIQPPPGASVANRIGFHKGAGLSWTGPAPSSQVLSADIRTPWPSRFSSLLAAFQRPILGAGTAAN